MAKQTGWVLLDCNNFYVSCERVFRPDLLARPVVVLSSDHGCVVARSAQVKQLGITTGQPRFQIEQLIRQHKIAVLASNFALYTDMSRRVMAVIARVSHSSQLEIYSIDECFLPYQQNKATALLFLKKLKTAVAREVGIPVTVGMAASKTLAKLAVKVAKNDSFTHGVMIVDKLSPQLAELPVNQVWGIGGQTARRLFASKITTIAQLLNLSPALIKQRYGLGLLRIYYELKGKSCLELSDVAVGKQQISCTRTLATAVASRQILLAMLASYLEQILPTLWQKDILAGIVGIYLRPATNFSSQQKRVVVYRSLLQASNFAPDIMPAVKLLLEQVFVPGCHYKQVGVILTGLEKQQAWQPNLFAVSPKKQHQKQQLLAGIEALANVYGKNVVHLGSCLPSVIKKQVKRYYPTTRLRSGAYTTCWQQLCRVH